MSSVRLRLQRGCTVAEDAYLERLARETRFSRGGRSMSSVRLRLMLQPEWTAEEDERLGRLARENGFGHWRRVARRMPGRSRRLCRARWRQLTREREACYLRTALAALSHHRDEAELLSRDWMRRWSKFIKKAAKRSPEKAEKYWKEFMKNAATGFVEDRRRCRSAPLPDVVESEPEPASPVPMRQHQEHSLADVLASGLSSYSLAPVDPKAGSLAVGFARMTI